MPSRCPCADRGAAQRPVQGAAGLPDHPPRAGDQAALDAPGQGGHQGELGRCHACTTGTCALAATWPASSSLPAAAPSCVVLNGLVALLQLRGTVDLSMVRPPAPGTGKSQYMQFSVRAAVEWLCCRVLCRVAALQVNGLSESTRAAHARHPRVAHSSVHVLCSLTCWVCYVASVACRHGWFDSRPCLLLSCFRP